MKKFLAVALTFFSVFLSSTFSAFAGDWHHGHHGYYDHGYGHHDSGHHYLFDHFLPYLLIPEPAPYYERRYREYCEPICVPSYWQLGYDEYGRRIRYFVRGYCE